MIKKKAATLPKDVNPLNHPELYKKFEEAKELLIADEELKPYIKRTVEGDASETGLVKWIQPLLMNGAYGCYNKDGLDSVRDKNPVYRDENGQETAIPFSSDIKFNCMVRKMEAEGNLRVYLKGAPDRVIVRCSSLLWEGKDVPLTERLKY